MSDLCRLIWCALIGLFRSRVALEAEILVLRHQLNVLRRKSPKRLAKTDEYRQFANDCIVWARIATSDDQREQFLELAKKWMSDAESIDRGIELRPKEAAKASEMAGEEIDRLGDPLATDEERQLRKRRLIKGPQEFRDIRSNRTSSPQP